MKRFMTRAGGAERRRRLAARRRWVLGGVYLALAAGILAAWPAFGQGTGAEEGAAATATAPAAVSPAAAAQARTQFEKARALYQQDRFSEAQTENQKALALDPHNSDAILLAKVLAEKTAAGGGAGAGAGARGGAGAKAAVLSAQQISMIRLMELSGADRNIRGKIDRSALEDFWQEVVIKDGTVDTSPQAHAAFLSPTNFAGQVRMIRDSGQSKFMNQVTITSDPATLRGAQNTFTQVQNYVLQSCATAECHGGDKAGAFRLIPNNTTGVSVEQQLYTNFYAMTMYKDAGGKMIDRENPEKSLFITYSLPKGHPTVSIPAKMQPNDAQYRRMIDWIRSLAFPQPNYGITFDLPKTATAPADADK